MHIKKTSIVLILILAVTTVLCGCTNTAQTPENTTAVPAVPKYSIGICEGANGGEFYEQILLGFETAINDNFPENNVTVTTLIADNNNGTITADNNTGMDEVAVDNYSLIYTIGEDALISAHNKTADIPIVSSGVMDYERVLSLTSDKEWDRTTKLNIAGVSSAPDMSDMLSLIIEATKELNSVGLLYCPDELDSIYQNHMLETYLTEAGIPWKEYEIFSPAISDRSIQELIGYACDESSVLYIPAASSLIEKLPAIQSVTMPRGIPTVGGDEHIGEFTLCCLYNDPFNQGYKAGEMAYDILTNGKKPGTITIKSTSYSSEQKLYSGYYADALGLTFPKSFKERGEFLSTYILGSKTSRNSAE